MRKNVLPDSKRDCPKGCEVSLRYYMEAPVALDLYYCEKCYKISEWNGVEVRGTDMEAYPNREKKIYA